MILKFGMPFRLGDKSAYAEIYEGYFDALYHYGRKFMVDQTRVEDAIQDLFINLWRTRERLSSVDNIKFCLFPASDEIFTA